MTDAAIIAVEFHKPTTKDFVFPAGELYGVPFQFIAFLVLTACLAFVLFFFFAFRKASASNPSKLQMIAEMGINFVKENIALQMIGPEGIAFMALLCTLFFYILFGNIFEVVPGINFSMNSRIAFPLVLALVVWVVYNYVGIKRHGFLGYAKMVLFPPGAPWLLYFLLTPIEFISTIVVRPITLSVRLFANMVAGHFLLAVFFLGSVAMLTSANAILKPIGLLSGAMGVVMVGFEIFVAGLQAFIFAVLTASYIGGALAEEH